MTQILMVSLCVLTAVQDEEADDQDYDEDFESSK